MDEQRRPVTGYEGLYEVTESGRIYSVKRKKFMSRCNDEYGFHNAWSFRRGVTIIYITCSKYVDTEQ